MKKKAFVFSLFLILLGLALPIISEKEKLNNLSKISEKVLGVAEYKSEALDLSSSKAEGLDREFPKEAIKGGIIPHDTRLGEYISHFFEGIKKQEPETVILLAPNHLEKGFGKITTSFSDWDTPWGRLKADSTIINQIQSELGIRDDDEVLTNEHAITDIVPYIKYSLPETKIVPLIFKAKVDLDELEGLKEIVTGLLKDGVIIVAAVDFSHYLPFSEAQIRDQVTEKALKALDYRTLLSFGDKFNEYLDSPPAIALLLMLMKTEAKNSEIIFHKNSALLNSDLSGPTTSYFEVVYY